MNSSWIRYTILYYTSVTNLSEHNLVAKRIIKSHLNHIGSVSKLEISQELLKYVGSAHKSYTMYLQKQKEKVQDSEKSKTPMSLGEAMSKKQKKTLLSNTIECVAHLLTLIYQPFWGTTI